MQLYFAFFFFYLWVRKGCGREWSWPSLKCFHENVVENSNITTKGLLGFKPDTSKKKKTLPIFISSGLVAKKFPQKFLPAVKVLHQDVPENYKNIHNFSDVIIISALVQLLPCSQNSVLCPHCNPHLSHSFLVNDAIPAFFCDRMKLCGKSNWNLSLVELEMPTSKQVAWPEVCQQVYKAFHYIII